MRLVAHISTTFNHRAGGISRLFKRMRALRDRGFPLALIVGRDYQPSPEWDLGGIDIYRIPSMVKYIDPVRDLMALLALIKLIRRIDPAVVHTHLAKAGILGRFAAHLCQTPLIMHTVHGPTFSETMPSHRRLLYQALERAAGRITDRFIFVGSDVRDQYLRHGVCDRSQTTVIRTGRPDAEIDRIKRVNSTELKRIRNLLFNASQNDFLMASVGRLVSAKQQEEAIRILGLLRGLGVPAKLVIVGEAYVAEEKSYLQTLKRLTAYLELEPHVHFTGYRRDALDIMAAVDAIIHTSKYEGLPNIMVEAAITGTPIVCYAVSGAFEVVRHQQTGFVLAQGDRKAAARRLFYLATHPERAEQMGLAAQQSFSDDYRESTMIQNKLAFYEKVVRPCMH